MTLSHVEYKNTFPEDIKKKLCDIYQSIYCTQEYLFIYKKLKNYYIFCIYDDNRLVHILIYQNSFCGINVLNELFKIEDQYINYFSEYIFENVKGHFAIHFNRLSSSISSKFPYKIWDIKNNIAINLPKDFEDYKSGLTKKTRTNFQYCTNKLKRDYGILDYQLQSDKQIEQLKIDAIFLFNKKRMNLKKIKSCFDKEFENKVAKLCSHYGIVGILNVKNEAIAGSISYQVGSQAYGYIISHDPDYNKYSPGIICNILMIKNFIEKGVEKFHMEYGESIYKYKLLGERNDVYYVTIYKNLFYNIIGQFIYYKKHRNYKRFINFIKYKFLYKFLNFN